MKKTAIILSVLALIACITILCYHQFVFADEFMFSEYSPDKQYRVDVYTERRLFAMPGDGGLYSRMAVVVLKNKWGWTIGKPCKQCYVPYGEIEIKWYPNEVEFSLLGGINLKTGKCTNH